MTPDKDLLRSFYMDKRNPKFPKDKIRSVQIADNRILLVEGFGNLNKDGIKVDDLLHVPEHTANLISVSQLVSQLSQQLEERLRLQEVARQLEAMAMPKLLIELLSCQHEAMDVPGNWVDDHIPSIPELYSLVRGINLSDASKERIFNRLASQLQAFGVHENLICEIAKQLKDMSVPQLEVDELAGQLEDFLKNGQLEDLNVDFNWWICKLGRHLLALDLRLSDLAPQLQALRVSLTPHRIKEFAAQLEALQKPQLQFDRLALLLQGMGVPRHLIQQLQNLLHNFGVPQLRIDELASQLEAMRVPQGLIGQLTTHLRDMSMPEDVIRKVATDLKDMGVSQLRTDDLVDYLQTLGMQLQIQDVATNLRAHGVTLLQTNELARELQALGAPWLLIDQIIRQLDDVGVAVEQQPRVDQLVATLQKVSLEPRGMDVPQHQVDHFVSQLRVQELDRQLSYMGVPQLLTRLLQTGGTPWSWINEIASQVKPVVPLSVGDFDITVGNHKVGSGTKPRDGLYQIKELRSCPLVQLSVKLEEATMPSRRQDRASPRHGEWVLKKIP